MPHFAWFTPWSLISSPCDKYHYLLSIVSDMSFHPCRVLQLPGCLLVAILGIVVNIPLISLISLYKGPILLFKGWHQLIRDLIGKEGPFLETVCVPFAGLWIFLWPFVVLFAIIAGILSSIPIGCYSAVVAYQVSLGCPIFFFLLLPLPCHMHPMILISHNCTCYFVFFSASEGLKVALIISLLLYLILFFIF